MVELYCVIHSGLLDQCIVCYPRYDNSLVIFVLHLQRLCQFSALVPLTAASTASAFQSTPPAARHHHSSFSSSHISTSSSQHTVALNTHYYPYPPFPFTDPYNNNPYYQNNDPYYNHPHYQNFNPYQQRGLISSSPCISQCLMLNSKLLARRINCFCWLKLIKEVNPFLVNANVHNWMMIPVS